MAFNDSIWERYGLGATAKVDDPLTKSPARRNIFFKADAGANPQAAGATIAALQQRGVLCLVCNRAMHGFAHEMATQSHQSPDSTYAELRANLIPGAYVLPSGLFGLVRAQNAGCAYMGVT
jgi:intracellular sulfur oxidation DsrE/DsrF family protein